MPFLIPNYSDTNPAAPAGRSNIKWQQSSPYPDPDGSGNDVADLSGSYALAAAAEIALSPSSPGNFTVAHGLSAAPRLVLIQMTSGGAIWFQSARYDATNIYLVASDAGVTGYAEAWL